MSNSRCPYETVRSCSVPLEAGRLHVHTASGCRNAHSASSAAGIVPTKTSRVVYTAPHAAIADAVLTARLALITGLADDLACANGSETPATRALADAIKREVEAVRRALNRPPNDLTPT